MYLVVKLFNAIQQSQASAAVAVEETKASRGSGKPTLPAPSFEKNIKGSKKAKNKDNPLGRGKESMFYFCLSLCVRRLNVPVPYSYSWSGRFPRHDPLGRRVQSLTMSPLEL